MTILPESDSSHRSDTLDPSREHPRYTIGAVTRMTAIPEATLRIWERRYHFPHTSRSSGGHRLYSQEEVLHLQWVKLRLDDGMRVSQAIHARQQTHRATAVAAALRNPFPTLQPSDPALAATHVILANHLLDALLAALLAYDSAQATTLLGESLARLPFESVLLDIIRPTMATIGDLWCNGELPVALEHFATNLLHQQLSAWMRESPTPFAVSPIVLACAPDELHEGSLLLLGALLRRRHWPVVYLGQALPLTDLAAVAARLTPAVIVFVAMRETSARALADWPHWLTPPPAGEPPIIAYGGRAFSRDPSLAQRVPGALLGATLAEGYLRLHRVMLNLNALPM